MTGTWDLGGLMVTSWSAVTLCWPLTPLTQVTWWPSWEPGTGDTQCRLHLVTWSGHTPAQYSGDKADWTSETLQTWPYILLCSRNYVSCHKSGGNNCWVARRRKKDILQTTNIVQRMGYKVEEIMLVWRERGLTNRILVPAWSTDLLPLNKRSVTLLFWNETYWRSSEWGTEVCRFESFFSSHSIMSCIQSFLQSVIALKCLEFAGAITQIVPRTISQGTFLQNHKFLALWTTVSNCLQTTIVTFERHSIVSRNRVTGATVRSSDDAQHDKIFSEVKYFIGCLTLVYSTLFKYFKTIELLYYESGILDFKLVNDIVATKSQTL